MPTLGFAYRSLRFCARRPSWSAARGGCRYAPGHPGPVYTRRDGRRAQPQVIVPSSGPTRRNRAVRRAVRR